VEVQQHYYLLSYLSSFSAVEKLSGKSKCWCGNCCHLQDAKKKLKVKSAPQVLTCQLKGFKYTVHEGEMEGFKKLFYHVAFPMEYILLINNCGDGEADDFLYSSFDVVVHVGCTVNDGNYISIVKRGDQWLMFYDEKVENITATASKQLVEDPCGRERVKVEAKLPATPPKISCDLAPKT
jgi:ubiquitin C-terminal hydrolase